MLPPPPLGHSPSFGGEDDVSNVSNGELGIMQYQRNVHEWGVLSPSHIYVLFLCATAAPPFAHFWHSHNTNSTLAVWYPTGSLFSLHRSDSPVLFLSQVSYIPPTVRTSAGAIAVSTIVLFLSILYSLISLHVRSKTQRCFFSIIGNGDFSINIHFPSLPVHKHETTLIRNDLMYIFIL
jgi:hypothetical protein